MWLPLWLLGLRIESNLRLLACYASLHQWTLLSARNILATHLKPNSILRTIVLRPGLFLDLDSINFARKGQRIPHQKNALQIRRVKIRFSFWPRPPPLVRSAPYVQQMPHSPSDECIDGRASTGSRLFHGRLLQFLCTVGLVKTPSFIIKDAPPGTLSSAG